MDQGRQHFRVRLVPHGGDWRAADVPRRAAELNQQAFALVETFNRGPLPQRVSFGSDGGGAVLVTVVKEAEDGGAWIVRAVETAGRPARAELELFGRAFGSDLGAHEIKTLLVPHDQTEPVREVNLLEW